MTNNNNTIITVVIIAVVLIGGYFLIKSGNQNSPVATNTSTTTPGSNTPVAGTGKVIFSVTDAAANMGAVTGVDVTVSKVELSNPTDGWFTASTEIQTFDLLGLKASGQNLLLATTNVPIGTYDQVRLTVDKVVVRTATTTTEAKLPSGMLKIKTLIVVKDGALASVHFDFLADQSLHLTGNGLYIFAPVISIQSKSGVDITVDANRNVKIDKGNVDSNDTVGMDVNGDVKSNFKLDTKSNLEIDSKGNINLKGLLKN